MNRIRAMISISITALFSVFLSFPPVYARMITQITPTLKISEEYNDNYLKTESDTTEEWITSCELGFTMGFLDKRKKIYLAYNPEYKDYKNLDERDGLEHNASLNAFFQPTKYTSFKADLGYDGHDGNNQGESWEHTAFASMDTQITEFMTASLSHSYSNSFDEQVRTGEYREHETNTSKLNLKHRFGARNIVGLNLIYEFDDYENSYIDEYKKYEPSAFIRYWLTRLDGIESNLGYISKDYDKFPENDIENINGDIRYIRRLSRNLEGYIKYRHYLSDRADGNHQVFHPSVGFDWQVTEDSGISLGIGILFHQWENNNDDTTEPFIDIDAYKIFNFSKKGSFSITGSSSYEESSDDAAGLGYNTKYEIGFSLDYKLVKELSSNLYGSYKLQDFNEDDVNRKDDTVEIGGGLTWNPLKWLQLNLKVSHKNFNSDDASRDDYEENKVTFFIKLIPENPLQPDLSPSRQSLEKELFDF